MEAVMNYLALGVGILGVIVILWGILKSIVQLAGLEMQSLRGASICKRRERLRHHLGSYLLLGLEFLVAADVIHTVTEPSLVEVGILGAIVAIRTVLNFFLNKELAVHDCEQDSSSSGSPPRKKQAKKQTTV
jgi:uncharacterized membrane protein